MNLTERTADSTATRPKNSSPRLNRQAASISVSTKIRYTRPHSEAEIFALKRRLAKLTQQLQETTSLISVWEDRSRSLSYSDQIKALQCLSNRNQCEAKARQLQQNVLQLKQQIERATERK